MKHRLSKKLRANIIRCLMCNDWELGFIVAAQNCTRCQFEGIAMEINRQVPTGYDGREFASIELFGLKATRNKRGDSWMRSNISDNWHNLIVWMMTKFDLTRENIQHENTNLTSSIT